MNRPNELSAQIYVDTDTPNMSVGVAEHGLDIVREIAPWIKISGKIGEIALETSDYCTGINGDTIRWPKLEGDLNIVLTKKPIIGSDQLNRDGRLNLRKLTQGLYYIGWHFNARRANGNRVALVSTPAIQMPEHIVAHEVGHLFGVEPQAYMQSKNGHCIELNCVMNAFLPEWGKKQRTFCSAEASVLYENAQRLSMYKAGKLALAPNAKIY